MNAEQGKTAKNDYKRAFGILAGALLILFGSEAVLREASVASLKSKDKDLDNILSSVPTFLRGRIKSRIEMMELKDAIARAKDDPGRMMALSALAAYVKEDGEKSRIYSEILKMPRRPESHQAMAYFLERDGSPDRISMLQYHQFIEESPRFIRHSLWSIGLQEMKNKKKSREIQLEFLAPLLSETPEFYDYRQLYKTIYDLAAKFDDKDKAKRADELAAICEDLPTIFEQMEKVEKEKAGTR